MAIPRRYPEVAAQLERIASAIFGPPAKLPPPASPEACSKFLERPDGSDEVTAASHADSQ